MIARSLHLRMLPTLLSTIVILAGGCVLSSGSTAAQAGSTPAAGCPVTLPNGNPPPGGQPSGDYLGNGKLWTELWPEGVVLMTPSYTDKPGGPYSMKFPWWRGVMGQLTITGRRLDGNAPPLTASIPEGYGDTSFQATGIIFPTAGCWEVTGHAGDASLTFVTLVVGIEEPVMTGVATPPAASASPASGCPVTLPNGNVPPGAMSLPEWRGAAPLWVVLRPKGQDVHPALYALPDGAFESMWDWWRGAPGALTIEGRRLDGPAPALGAVVPGVYGDSGDQPAVLFFPTPGCWQVTGKLGQAALTVVVQVIAAS